MTDNASGPNDLLDGDSQDTVRIELPREACHAISEMCAYLADMIAANACGCETCDERREQAETWEAVFRGMAEAETGTTHELVVGPVQYVH